MMFDTYADTMQALIERRPLPYSRIETNELLAAAYDEVRRFTPATMSHAIAPQVDDDDQQLDDDEQQLDDEQQHETQSVKRPRGAQETKPRKRYTCAVCGKPRKGHSQRSCSKAVPLAPVAENEEQSD